jgi:solute carrier family 25 (mitochondrial S-adenosylmethionine transporter), member 26
MVSGGVAGFSVDVALFPLDTIKTRMQAPEGFLKAGGFRGIYNGLLSAAVGSVPGASAFFVSYETANKALPDDLGAGRHMAAAAVGETMACLVRVPTENVKQKMQAGVYKTTSATLRGISSMQGGWTNFYTGYFTTVLREIPFAFIQFPIWEKLKGTIAAYQGYAATPVQGGICGTISGSFAAAITTPLDVVKTRLMLGTDVHGVQYKGFTHTLGRIYAEEGWRALFSGVVPRTFWIGIGGFVFLGAYEQSKLMLGGETEDREGF